MTKNVVSASPTSQKLFELLCRFPERLELFAGLIYILERITSSCSIHKCEECIEKTKDNWKVEMVQTNRPGGEKDIKEREDSVECMEKQVIHPVISVDQ